ncbi:hypothetical protein IMCC9480_3156 [Oxalobacteraceae bacterium IMCC9480]|nr:hypothetical protein IMCC9480_3156 [Oxalobacteraceae bacterium IMCC9480]
MHSIVNHEDAADFHRALAQFNVDRLAIGKPCAEWAGQLQTEYAWRHSEGVYLESLRAAVVPLMPSVMPSGDAFVAWFSALETTGPGQQHRLFDWLAQTATLPQLRWFLTQEAAGEAGFDDLLALTLVKLPVRPKLECARNFWDEMGHGKAAAMHGGMLERMVSGLDLQPSIASTVREALALSNPHDRTGEQPSLCVSIDRRVGSG